MKKLLSLVICLALLLSATIMGIGTQASALEASPEGDFIAFDGVLEEYIGPGGVVVIPATIEGERITEIAAQAFMANSDIEEVYIPEGVEIIGNRAFFKCSNLYKVEFPYSLYQFGSETFTGCALEAVTVPGSVEKVAYNTFGGNNGLRDIVISYGVKEIHSNGFGSTFPKRVVFPETVELVAAAAFNYLQTQDRVEFIICNPNLTLGVKVAAGGLWKDMMDGKWTDEIFRPWNSSLGSGTTNFKVVVPEGSKIAEFVKDWENNGLLEVGKEAGACNNSYTVVEEDEEYFKDLEENQKDWGIVGTRDDLKNESATVSDNEDDQSNNDASNKEDEDKADNDTSSNKDEENKDDNDSSSNDDEADKDDNDSSSNKDEEDEDKADNDTSSNDDDNKKDEDDKQPSKDKDENEDSSGSSTTTTIIEEGGDDSTLYIILGVVGGVFLLIIIGVVIFAVFMLKGGKKNAPVATPAPVAAPTPEAAPAAEENTEAAPTDDAE